MRGADWLLMLSLLDGSRPPNERSAIGSPLRGVWTLIKVLLFFFLLMWFLFHQDFVSLEVKPLWLESRVPETRQQLTSHESGNYIVKPGETISEIAHRHGISSRLLMKVNKLRDPHRIFPKQQLIVPARHASSRTDK